MTSRRHLKFVGGFTVCVPTYFSELNESIFKPSSRKRRRKVSSALPVALKYNNATDCNKYNEDTCEDNTSKTSNISFTVSIITLETKE